LVTDALSIKSLKITQMQTDKGNEDKLEEVANKAMDKLNDRLKLNVRVRCDFQTGSNYSECH